MANKIIIYSTAFCGYCTAAKRLLNSKGVEFFEIRLDQEPHRWEEMLSLSGGRRTVPQIFIGETHVGGFDDLSRMDIQGELEPLLDGMNS